jgi:hypothetical protein
MELSRSVAANLTELATVAEFARGMSSAFSGCHLLCRCRCQTPVFVRGCSFDQSSQQRLVYFASKPNLSIQSEDGDTGSEFFDQFWVGIDIDERRRGEPSFVRFDQLGSFFTKVAAFASVEGGVFEAAARLAGSPGQACVWRFRPSQQAATLDDAGQPRQPPQPVVLVPGSRHPRDTESGFHSASDGQNQAESQQQGASRGGSLFGSGEPISPIIHFSIRFHRKSFRIWAGIVPQLLPVVVE